MSNQLTFFGTRAVSRESYVVYRNPTRYYESFVERYCPRARRDRGYITNQKIVSEAQSMWTNVYKGNRSKLEEFLVLQANEKAFVRYFI